MGASSTAILVLVGQFNQLSVQTIRVAHTFDEFRQFAQDIDRQGLIVWNIQFKLNVSFHCRIQCTYLEGSVVQQLAGWNIGNGREHGLVFRMSSQQSIFKVDIIWLL